MRKRWSQTKSFFNAWIFWSAKDQDFEDWKYTWDVGEDKVYYPGVTNLFTLDYLQRTLSGRPPTADTIPPFDTLTAWAGRKCKLLIWGRRAAFYLLAELVNVVGTKIKKGFPLTCARKLQRKIRERAQGYEENVEAFLASVEGKLTKYVPKGIRRYILLERNGGE